MDLANFREYCLSKANAAEGTPFGPDVLVFRRILGGLLEKIASFRLERNALWCHSIRHIASGRVVNFGWRNLLRLIVAN